MNNLRYTSLGPTQLYYWTIFFAFKDGDGKVSLEEYIGDMYHHDEEDGPAGEEPDWVKRERESFKEVRDTNNDGFMDNQEVAKIIFSCIQCFSI